MYCPVCFDQCLYIRPTGKAYLAINGKQLSTAMFLYNTEKQNVEEINKNLESKIDEILKWYAGFENIRPITRFEVFSSEFECENKCKIPASTKISLIGSLVQSSIYYSILQKLTHKYSIQLKLSEESIAV